jgi:hypothetical protein
MLTRIAHLARHPGDPRILRTGPSSLAPAARLGRMMGWFGLALGLAQLVAPRRFTRPLGLRGREGLVRACGAREVASGLLSLSIDRRLGLTTRIAGDAMDIATLLGALHRSNPRRDKAALALAGVLAATVLDVAAAAAESRRHARARGFPRDYADRSGFPKGLEAARRGREAELPAPANAI